MPKITIYKTDRMKTIVMLISICILTACNQQTSLDKGKNKNHNAVSVFEDPQNENLKNLKHVTEELVAPPFLPAFAQVATGDPVIVDIKLVIQEKKLQIAPDATIWALTYNGSVPGPMIVVHQDDYV